MDICPFECVDVVYPAEGVLPFAQNSIDEVYSKHVLEHVEDIWHTMADLHRVCKAGAVLNLCLPHFSCPSYHWNLDHKRPFGLKTMAFAFDPTIASPTLDFLRGNVWFESVSVRFEWWDEGMINQKHGWRKFTLKPLNFTINALANAAPFLCERLWCRWVGGFDNIWYELRAIK